MVSPCAAAASFAKVDAENGQFTYDHSVKTFVVGADGTSLRRWISAAKRP
jgi:hypothetical protein